MYLGAIADDVTGGTDLASVLRREGATVIQTFEIPSSPVPDVDAIVVSLKTRTAPVDVAIERSTAASVFLEQAGARQLYFKYCSTFDSTDAGNIGPVIDLLLDRTGAEFTVVCPAYPALRRTTYLGYLFVGDQPLSESSMRHHPLTPMGDANLVRVLARQTRSQVGSIPLATVEIGAAAVSTMCASLAEAGCRMGVVDAVFDRHIRTVAEACADSRLVTGGAALGGALGGLRSRGRRQQIEQPLKPPIAVLSGSCSSATVAQVRRLRERVPSRALNPVALVEQPGELESLTSWACAQAARGHLLIYSTDAIAEVEKAQTALGRASASTLIESAFRHLSTALAACGVRTFVVAGGETSGAVLQALGVRMLRFGDEIDPGVPWTYSLDPEGFTLALKSGNFGGRDFFIKALEQAV
jgi:3-dehydrotetronate 4-kinase